MAYLTPIHLVLNKYMAYYSIIVSFSLAHITSSCGQIGQIAYRLWGKFVYFDLVLPSSHDLERLNTKKNPGLRIRLVLARKIWIRIMELFFRW